MFKRSNVPSKARRGSSADVLSSPQNGDESAGSIGSSGPASATWATFPGTNQEGDLLPGEEYSFLLTPGLPFDCDYAETFGTVCDVLMDTYRHLGTAMKDTAEVVMGGQAAPEGLSMQSIGDMFNKVDAKVKKLVLVGLVREFEDASRQGVKSEVAGVGKLVLGGFV